MPVSSVHRSLIAHRLGRTKGDLSRVIAREFGDPSRLQPDLNDLLAHAGGGGPVQQLCLLYCPYIK